MRFSNETIDVSKLPSVKAIDYHGLAKPYRWLLLIQAAVFFIFLGLIAFFVVIIGQFWYVSTFMWGVPGLLLLLLILFVRAWKVFDYKGYALRQKDVSYQSGWLWKRKVVVPYNRIQHVELHRGPIEELLHLRRLRIYTAGGSSSDLTIPGLSPERAEEMRQFISSKTNLDEEE